MVDVATIQALAYTGKIIIHPTPVTSFGEFVQRAAIGPIPGEAILAAGVVFNGIWIIFRVVTSLSDPGTWSMPSWRTTSMRGVCNARHQGRSHPSRWLFMGNSFGGGKKAGRMARARGHGAFGGECAYQRSLLEMSIDASVLSDGDVKCSLFTALGRRRALVRSRHARF